MIKIAICDDEEKVGLALESIATDLLTDLNIDHEIDVLLAPNEVEKRIQAGKMYDLFFLDIVYPQNEETGITLAKHIRKKRNQLHTSIVFISRESRYAMDLFQVQPLNFLIKPLSTAKIDAILRQHLALVGYWNQMFTYQKNRNLYTLPLRDLVYIESVGRKLYLHLADGPEIELNGSLKDIYKSQLQTLDFLYIHANYVVNFDYIQTLAFGEVALKNSQKTLAISKHRQAEVRNAYKAILKRRL